MYLCHHSNPLAAQECPQGWNRAIHDPRSVEQQQQEQLANGAPRPQNAQIQNLTLHITQAPAEFTLPVKQDRQFMPPFKVKARPHRVVACAALSVFVGVAAHAFVQPERLRGSPPLLPHAATVRLYSPPCPWHQAGVVLRMREWLQVHCDHTGWGSQLAPLTIQAFLLTVKHQGTLSPMLFHKLIGGAEYQQPKKPSCQGKGAAHRNLENLKGVTSVFAVFKVRALFQCTCRHRAGFGGRRKVHQCFSIFPGFCRFPIWNRCLANEECGTCHLPGASLL
jgi:hypothetical protein